MTTEMAEKIALTLEQVPAVDRKFRFQWEEAQQCYVLLYPEGLIKLNGSAGEIMKRVNGASSIADIAADCEKSFNQRDLKKDVIAFLEIAHERGWVNIK